MVSMYHSGVCSLSVVLSRIPLNSSLFSSGLCSCVSSPVITDPATPTCSAIYSSLSPVNLRPSLHLQLISALGAVYLYLPAIICSLPDCLVCFAKLSRDLYVNHKPDYPVFRPWTVPRIPFSLPAPRLTCLPVLSDLPVLTLPACPPITDYPACSLSDGLLYGRISRF